MAKRKYIASEIMITRLEGDSVNLSSYIPTKKIIEKVNMNIKRFLEENI